MSAVAYLHLLLQLRFPVMQNLESDGGESAPRPLVFFDLETTGLGPNCEIIQLAAVSGGHSLNLYVVPRARIERGAAKVTEFKSPRPAGAARTVRSSVSACVDTLPLAREVLSERNLQSFSQEKLVRELLGVNYKAHDALEDVRALQMLYAFIQPTAEQVRRHTFTLDSLEKKTAFSTKDTSGRV
ncbi:hypothetical protein OJAV_G00052520 [Oryzias javanicus]|uniref:exodeoxyribonuclease III n=1 Tax=Oryzias javanicus TaxID=123683 RepID=A0A3S2PBU8_ORYJA|nr:hypothetical protein OJAV_G00052520 [Oryzias javanicus]